MKLELSSTRPLGMKRTTLLLALVAPAGCLMSNGVMRAHRGDPFAVATATASPALVMQANGDEGRFSFLRPVRTAGTTLAAAAFLAVVGPRGSARAAEPLEAPTRATTSRAVDHVASRLTFSGERGDYSVKTLSPRRGSIDQLEEDMAEAPTSAPEEGKLPADMSDLFGRNAHRQYVNDGFIFSDQLTELSPLQSELDELDYFVESNRDVARFKGVVKAGTVVGIMCEPPFAHT